MTLSSFGRKGRLVTALAACGLLLGGCVLATASGRLAEVLLDGKMYALKDGEFLVPRSTLDQWRRQIGESKARLLARCSYDTGLCTTVVVPLVTPDPVSPEKPGLRCRSGETVLENDPEGQRCLTPLHFDLGQR